MVVIGVGGSGVVCVGGREVGGVVPGIKGIRKAEGEGGEIHGREMERTEGEGGYKKATYLR